MAGAQIPQVIFNLLSTGVLNAVLVPQIVRTLKQKDADERLSKLITLSIALLLAITLLMASGTPLLTMLYLDSSWTPAQRALANAFTLWCMPRSCFTACIPYWGRSSPQRGVSRRMRGAPSAPTSSAASVSARSSCCSATRDGSRCVLDIRQDSPDRGRLDGRRGVPGPGAVHSFAALRHPLPASLGTAWAGVASHGPGGGVEHRHGAAQPADGHRQFACQYRRPDRRRRFVRHRGQRRAISTRTRYTFFPIRSSPCPSRPRCSRACPARSASIVSGMPAPTSAHPCDPPVLRCSSPPRS